MHEVSVRLKNSNEFKISCCLLHWLYEVILKDSLVFCIYI